VVDAANGIGRLRPAVEALSVGRPIVAIATHAHFDHVGGLAEFDDRRCHPSDSVMPSPAPLRLHRDDFPEWLLEDFRYYGSPVPEFAVTAVPDDGFDPRSWSTPSTSATSFVGDGDAIDLGDRTLEVVHTPGHTAGSICLWERATGTLFTGDAVYVDERLGWEDAEAFAGSLRRLRDFPATVVHTGHGRSFDGDELRARIDEVLREMAATGERPG
jgi:glyoxylase-like metal-dependent hydrolase (beta-lactamase superfamily II)